MTRFFTAAGLLAIIPMGLMAQPPAPPPAAPKPPRQIAPVDLTGTWVSLVTEDWLYRMVTPAKKDYASLPLNPEGRKVADNWDPAVDEAAGNACKAYGAPAIMRVPGRVRISWQDDITIKVETDAGTQTRLLRFGNPPAPAGDLGWQGHSVATWEMPAAGRGPAAPGPRGGSLKVVTTKAKPGYLRKNGVPYSANAVMTEYFDRFDVPGVESLLVVTTEIVDPENLTTPYWTSPHFKKTDASGWHPTPCSAR
jgi:hypothetical protein